jgi:hypothetical protein
MDLGGADTKVLVKRDVNILEIAMTKMNKDITQEPLTRRDIYEITAASAKIAATELLKEISPVQIKADAKGLMELGLTRLGFKPNWKERIFCGAVGAAGASIVWLNFISF